MPERGSFGLYDERKLRASVTGRSERKHGATFSPAPCMSAVTRSSGKVDKAMLAIRRWDRYKTRAIVRRWVGILESVHAKQKKVLGWPEKGMLQNQG